MPMDHSLSQLNPIRILSLYYFKVYFNIIFHLDKISWVVPLLARGLLSDAVISYDSIASNDRVIN
jgi:hypothetical protein